MTPEGRETVETDWSEFREQLRDATDEQLRGMKRAGSEMVVHLVLKEMARRAKSQDPQ